MGDQDNLKNDVVIYEKPLWYSGTKHEKRHQDVSLVSDQPHIHSDSPVPGMAEAGGKQKFLSPSASLSPRENRTKGGGLGEASAD